MKLIIYIVLFVLLIFYVKKNKNSENFKIDSYTTNSILSNSNSNDDITGTDFNQESNYSNKFWVVKPSGMSDMFNNEDLSSKVTNDDKENKEEKVNIQETNKNIVGNVPRTLNDSNNNYTLLGLAVNEYYNQYYLIYENQLQLKQQEKKLLNNKLYQYMLVKIIDEKPNIIHRFSPRTKINIRDVTYLAQGPLQLGPFFIKPITN